MPLSSRTSPGAFTPVLLHTAYRILHHVAARTGATARLESRAPPCAYAGLAGSPSLPEPSLGLLAPLSLEPVGSEVRSCFSSSEVRSWATRAADDPWPLVGWDWGEAGERSARGRGGSKGGKTSAATCLLLAALPVALVLLKPLSPLRRLLAHLLLLRLLRRSLVCLQRRLLRCLRLDNCAPPRLSYALLMVRHDVAKHGRQGARQPVKPVVGVCV